jgi:hypothetical protein
MHIPSRGIGQQLLFTPDSPGQRLRAIKSRQKSLLVANTPQRASRLARPDTPFCKTTPCKVGRKTKIFYPYGKIVRYNTTCSRGHPVVPEGSTVTCIRRTTTEECSRVDLGQPDRWSLQCYQRLSFVSCKDCTSRDTAPRLKSSTCLEGRGGRNATRRCARASSGQSFRQCEHRERQRRIRRAGDCRYRSIKPTAREGA